MVESPKRRRGWCRRRRAEEQRLAVGNQDGNTYQKKLRWDHGRIVAQWVGYPIRSLRLCAGVLRGAVGASEVRADLRGSDP